MHGLETIHRQNQTRFEKAIDNYRSQGRWVLAKYTGLHLVSIETFGSAEEAAPVYAAAFNLIGDHAKLLPPTPEWYAANRDQSEDRPARRDEFGLTAEQGGVFAPSLKTPPVTLGDYIESVQQAEGL